MGQTVGALMTKILVQLPDETNLVDAARAMRDAQIGDVLVTNRGRLAGVATDRDIVIRAIAEGLDPATTPLSEVISGDIVSIPQDAPAAMAADLMRERAVRRLVVTDGDSISGIVTLGDLAAELDPTSALATISTAPPTE